MQMFNLSSLTVITKIHAVSLKLYVPGDSAGVASIHKWTIKVQTQPFISESKHKKLTVRKQLPFHKDKDFQQPNFFMQMLIVSMVCTAWWVDG